MYTHIGDDKIVKTKDVIAIFDIKTIEQSKQNKRIQFEMKRKNLKGESVILMQDGKDYTEITSKISVATLKKRIENGIFKTKER